MPPVRGFPLWGSQPFVAGSLERMLKMDQRNRPTFRSGSTEFVTIMSTYILLFVVPAQSSPGYGSEMNCPLKTMPALSSPTRIKLTRGHPPRFL